MKVMGRVHSEGYGAWIVKLWRWIVKVMRRMDS